MKKHLVTLFVFIYIAAFFFSALTGVVTRAEELQDTNTTEESAAQETDPSEPVVSAPTEPEILPPSQWEAKEPKWISYWDFCCAENVLAYEDPSVFVGCIGRFDVETWSNFHYAATPAAAETDNETDYLEEEDLLTDASGKGIPVRAVDYLLDSESQLWYKIESVEGYPLPQVLIDNPYILHLRNVEDLASLLWEPLMGMFVGETVDIKKQAVAASNWKTLSTENLPRFFDITPVYDAEENCYYDLGNITAWDPTLTEAYRYVGESAVIPISAAVTKIYEALQNADSAEEFRQIWESTPDSVKNHLTPGHLEAIVDRQDALANVIHKTTVLVGEVSVPVTVTVPIPETGVTLSATLVSNEQVIEEGFDVKPDASDVITALDIKLLKEDGTEWQPADGQQITVTIGVGELGIADETVVKMRHKHGDIIYKQDIFLVLDGKVTVKTSGLSIFSVLQIPNTTQYGVVKRTNDGGTIELTVGVPVILYDDTNASACSWTVVDTEGAIHYTVHGTSMTPGNYALDVPWIKIVPLRAGTITLTFNRYNNNQSGSETFTVNIVSPKAEKGQTAFYLKDDVNLTGRLIATLVDENGNEKSLAGAAFAWSRNDSKMISPNAYGSMEIDGMTVANISVDIARDHGGLKEASMNAEKTAYEPTIYTCKVTFPDGSTDEASYTVYYQSEFINSGFEFPDGTNNAYNFFPNGYPEMYWKTTAQGVNDDIGKDIEYRDVTTVQKGGSDDSEFGVERAADDKTGGTQFAELNAEEIGALYQDIITAPGEDIEWKFSHAPRRQQSWTKTPFANKMFVVIGSTEEAQKLTTQDDLMAVCDAAKRQNITDPNTSQPVIVTMDNGAVFYVWYHDAGAPEMVNTNNWGASNGLDNNYSDNIYDHASDDGSYYYGWTQLSGSYAVPANQYRTRLFFVSDTEGNAAENYGNLIDVARAGQYKTFLIEYYEETFIGNSNKATLVHMTDFDEKGEALIYSSEELKKLVHFLDDENDYLHTILINGKNYPYTIRYNVDAQGNPYPDNQAYLYIEKYLGNASHYEVANEDPNNKEFYDPTYTQTKKNNYADYDIVMQITLRDTVIAVQKIIEFPETLTQEQKLKIINDLRTSNNKGYEAKFELTAVTVIRDEKNNIKDIIKTGQPEEPTGTAIVNQRDPQGQYTGFVSLGKNPSLGPNATGQDYIVTETHTTDIPGLILTRVSFSTTMYQYGANLKPTANYYNEVDISTKALSTLPFTMKSDAKIADIVVKNYYKEKMTKVTYKAVGKGKVELQGTEGNVVIDDSPSEYLEFYSGKANGAIALPGENAVFVGWFTDPSCSEESRVTAVNGVYNEAAKTFVPNTNIIEAEAVTFYAKFDTCSIVIERKNAEPGETFVYEVLNTDTGKSFYVTVTSDENGNYRRKIQEIPVGNYKVTELHDWSWRHTEEASQTKERDANASVDLVFTFDSDIPEENSYWLTGWSQLLENVFKKSVPDTSGG